MQRGTPGQASGRVGRLLQAGAGRNRQGSAALLRVAVVAKPGPRGPAEAEAPEVPAGFAAPEEAGAEFAALEVLEVEVEAQPGEAALRHREVEGAVYHPRAVLVDWRLTYGCPPQATKLDRICAAATAASVSA